MKKTTSKAAHLLALMFSKDWCESGLSQEEWFHGQSHKARQNAKKSIRYLSTLPDEVEK